MKVLVVGGAGYIGSHVSRALLDKGHEVTVFDNLSTGLTKNLFPESTFIEGDIGNEKQINDAFATGIDAFIHLAAFKAAGESMFKPEKYSVNNINGTLTLLNAAVAHGIKRAVFSSSAAVYGEPKYLPIDENHPKDPENYYGFTKLEIERFLGWYDKLKGLRFASLRYFNAAGYDVNGRITGLERNPANLLPVVMEVAAGMREKIDVFGSDYDTPDGTGVRDYVHVSDLADAHVLGLEYLEKTDQSIVVNLGSENGISVKEMVDAARRITGKPVRADYVARRPGDPGKLVASSKKAHELLGWTAKHSDVETLISSTWKAYTSQ